MSDTAPDGLLSAMALEGHPLAAAARTLFAELVAKGVPVVGTGMGEGQIFLRVSGENQADAAQKAPTHFRGYPVIILTDHEIRR